jgi:hypothetical protein
MPITFLAMASDPDHDALSYQWTYDEGPCVGAAPRSVLIPGGSTFQVNHPALGPFCVWLRVSDPYGAASGLAFREATVVNAAPEVMLTVQQPGGNPLADFPLYSNFRISAAATRDVDQDPLTRHWSWVAFPDASATVLDAACAPTAPADLAACFHADVPGKYQLALEVSDGSLTGQNSVTVSVADDAPPCLRAPGSELPRRVADPAAAQQFSVTAADDGDPWPPANPSYAAAGFPVFAWRIRRNGGDAQTVAGTGLDTLPIAPGQFTVGDRAEITVEVADRKRRSLDGCGAAPTCELNPGCAQRATWTVEFL